MIDNLDTYEIITNSTNNWKKIYKIAQDDKTHWLWENYQNINLDEYESMIVNIRNNQPAAFHGIYNNGRWPDNVSRFCNRAYINPHFRNLGQGLEITWKNIKFVLDNYNQWKKEILFISRGVQYNDPYVSWLKFDKFCKFLSNKTGYNLVWDDLLYQCCNNSCKDCYQFCVWYDPMDIRKKLKIHHVTIDEWRNLSDN